MARLIEPFKQFFDGAGDPLVAGKLKFLESGSSSALKDTFADSAETIPNSNPVILTGDGTCPNVFGSGTYRVILTDSDDVQILQRDPVGGDTGVAFGADWNATQIYGLDDVVRDGGEYWISLISANQGINPTTDGGSNWILWPSVTASEVVFTPAGSIAAINVQAAIEELDASAFNGTEATVTPAFNDKGAIRDVSDSDNPKYALLFNQARFLYKGADIASATAITLGADGNYFDITGTNAITSIATVGIGARVKFHFDAILTLTHSATDLILPGGANITTAAGDEAEFIEYATADWRCVSYVKADGTAVVSSAAGGITIGTEVDTSTGATSYDITGFPSGTKRIVIMYNNVSTTSTSPWIIQIGDSGGIETTGYTGGAILQHVASPATNSTGFLTQTTIGGANLYFGRVVLELYDDSLQWSLSGFVFTTAGASYGSSGYKTLSAELDRFRLTTIGGSDTFDSGNINIQFES